MGRVIQSIIYFPENVMRKKRIKRSKSAVCGVNSTSDVVVFVSVLSFFGAELTLSGTPGLWSSKNFIMRIFSFPSSPRLCVYGSPPRQKRLIRGPRGAVCLNGVNRVLWCFRLR